MDQEKTLQNILETVEFIKDNAAAKEDLERFATKEDLERFVTKEELSDVKDEIMAQMDDKLAETKDEIMTQIDKFIALHQKLDLEMSAFRSRFERLELEMQKSLKNRNADA